MSSNSSRIGAHPASQSLSRRVSFSGTEAHPACQVLSPKTANLKISRFAFHHFCLWSPLSPLESEDWLQSRQLWCAWMDSRVTAIGAAVQLWHGLNRVAQPCTSGHVKHAQRCRCAFWHAHSTIIHVGGVERQHPAPHRHICKSSMTQPLGLVASVPPKTTALHQEAVDRNTCQTLARSLCKSNMHRTQQCSVCKHLQALPTAWHHSKLWQAKQLSCQMLF